MKSDTPSHNERNSMNHDVSDTSRASSSRFQYPVDEPGTLATATADSATSTSVFTKKGESKNKEELSQIRSMTRKMDQQDKAAKHAARIARVRTSKQRHHSSSPPSSPTPNPPSNNKMSAAQTIKAIDAAEKSRTRSPVYTKVAVVEKPDTKPPPLTLILDNSTKTEDSRENSNNAQDTSKVRNLTRVLDQKDRAAKRMARKGNPSPIRARELGREKRAGTTAAQVVDSQMRGTAKSVAHTGARTDRNQKNPKDSATSPGLRGRQGQHDREAKRAAFHGKNIQSKKAALVPSPPTANESFSKAEIAISRRSTTSAYSVSAIPGAFHGTMPLSENFGSDEEAVRNEYSSSSALTSTKSFMTETARGNDVRMNRDGFLVEATLVEESKRRLEGHEQQFAPFADIAEAKALDETEMATSFLRSRIGCAVVCVVLLIIAVLVIGLTLGLKEGNMAPTQPTSKPPTMAPTLLFESQAANDLLEVLPLAETTIFQIMDDVDSAQSKAFRWMLEDRLLETRTPLAKIQRFALASFYFATDGANWTNFINWLSHESQVCSWFTSWGSGSGCDSVFYDDDSSYTGEAADDNSTTIKAFVLRDNYLNGSINAEIALLSSSLIVLDLSDNLSLDGSIPTEIGSLTSLRSLSLSDTRVSMQLPSEIGNLVSLKYLYLSHTLLSSTIPTEIGLIRRIEGLYMQSAILSGSIPSELFFGSSSSLFLDLSYNKLTGTLDMGKSSNLVHLDLCSNSISGSLNDIGRHRALSYINLNENLITGTLSTEIAKARNLESLNVASNHLSSSIPTEYGGIGSLCIMNISHNKITGTIPKEFAHLCSGFPAKNSITGSQAVVVKGLSSFGLGGLDRAPGILNQTHVIAAVTKSLEGALLGLDSIEAEIVAFNVYDFKAYLNVLLTCTFVSGSVLPTRQELIHVLEENPLTFGWNVSSEDGSISTESLRNRFSGWNSQLQVDLSWNSISGEVPSELFGLQSPLTTLHLHSNELTGTIPSSIGAATDLVELNLSSNNMDGTLIEELGSLASLTSLNLASNRFSGSVPELVGLKNLTELHLGLNNFSGGIPTFGSMQSLAVLNMESQNLSGPIPTELVTLKSLCHVDFSDNSLGSSLPTELGLLCPGIREYAVKIMGRSSIAFPITLSFSFTRFWNAARPRDDEVEALKDDVESYMLSNLKYDFEHLQSLNLTLLNNSFQVDDSFPLSLVFQAELDFRPESAIPAAEDMASVLESSYVSDSFLFDVLWQNSFYSTFYDADRVVFKRAFGDLYLDLSYNSFSGSIPTELSSLLEIPSSYVNLEGNSFTGTLPSALCPGYCKKSDDANATSVALETAILIVDCDALLCDCDCE